MSAGELVPAIGVGIAAGLAAFYVTRILLSRTPLRASSAATPPDGAARLEGPARVPRTHGG